MSIVAKQSPVSETAELLSIRQLNFALKAMPLLKTKPGIKFGNVPVHVESQLAISTCSDSSNLSAKVCDLDSVMEFGLYSTVSKIRRVWSTKVESLDFLARLYRFGDMKAHILLIQIAFFSTQHVGLFDPPPVGVTNWNFTKTFRSRKPQFRRFGDETSAILIEHRHATEQRTLTPGL